MSHCYLLLWLESPMQAWGFDSRFDRRETLEFPTKSGVIGLICCAMGASGPQRSLLARLGALAHDILAFAPQSSKHWQDKQVTRLQMLRDFHMVGSGYDEHQIWQNLLIPKTKDGLKPTGGGAKLTHRYYLQQAYFAAIIQVPEDLADPIAQALMNPVWDLYLGRKNCVPTDFIYRGWYLDYPQAADQALALAHDKALQEDFRVYEGEHEGEVLALNDVPVAFGVQKEYQQRYVTVIEP